MDRGHGHARQRARWGGQPAPQRAQEDPAAARSGGRDRDRRATGHRGPRRPPAAGAALRPGRVPQAPRRSSDIGCDQRTAGRPRVEHRQAALERPRPADRGDGRRTARARRRLGYVGAGPARRPVPQHRRRDHPGEQEHRRPADPRAAASPEPSDPLRPTSWSLQRGRDGEICAQPSRAPATCRYRTGGSTDRRTTTGWRR